MMVWGSPMDWKPPKTSQKTTSAAEFAPPEGCPAHILRDVLFPEAKIANQQTSYRILQNVPRQRQNPRFVIYFHQALCRMKLRKLLKFEFPGSKALQGVLISAYPFHHILLGFIWGSRLSRVAAKNSV